MSRVRLVSGGSVVVSCSVVACTLLVSQVAMAQGAPPPVAPATPAAGGAPPAAAGAAAVAKPSEEEEKDKPAPNSIFVEGLGAGGLYSLNYERRFVDDLGVRIGFSYLSMSASAGSTSASASLLTVPITVEYLGVRGRKSGLEVGGGMTLSFAGAGSSTLVASGSASATVPIFTGMLGYRLHPAGGAGFQFRVGVGLLAAQGLSLDAKDPDKFGVLPWGYISFGAGF